MEKEMQIALIYVKIFMTLHNKRNVLIKTKPKFCFLPIRLAKIPKRNYMLMRLKENWHWQTLLLGIQNGKSPWRRIWQYPTFILQPSNLISRYLSQNALANM